MIDRLSGALRLAAKNLWTLLFLCFMLTALWMLLGCSTTKVTPASNSSTVHQNDTPPSKRVTLTVGGQNVPVSNGPKTQPDRR